MNSVIEIEDIRKLEAKKKVVQQWLTDRKLSVKEKLSPGDIKRELIKYVQANCIHPADKRRILYDMSACRCPNCETVLSFDWDGEDAFCPNCDYRGNIEEHGAFQDENLDDFYDVEQHIICSKCEYQGHPDRNPQHLIVELVDSEIEVW